jgi:CRISPR/Cas system Type II protein with McrA/HNH and RuvC-like nuclease domain
VNKDLYGKQYQIPEHILNALKTCANNETIANLLKSGNISYSLIKKCIHRMENGEKDTLGGDTFYGWLKQTLNSDRSGLETSKKAKADAGVSNAHIAPHEKGDLRTMNRPGQSHSRHNAELKITESLKRINEIISKLI